jgi:bifunctional non-homologous end joining protein LigD
MGLRFIVHRSAASSPYFDLRLELDGVLKSWAIPGAGPDPRDAPWGPDPRDAPWGPDPDAAKRLAVRTEDHPLGHPDSAVWDHGTWIPEGSALASFRRGSLRFELKGKRMKGRWALVRMGNASTRKKDLWLLVKRDDAIEAKATAPARAARGKAVRVGDARR